MGNFLDFVMTDRGAQIALAIGAGFALTVVVGGIALFFTRSRD